MPCSRRQFIHSVCTVPALAAVGQDSGLTLQIEVPAKTFWAYEPVPLRVLLRNTTTRSVSVRDSLSPFDGFLDITVTIQYGHVVPRRPLLHYQRVRTDLSLAAGEFIGTVELLHYAGDQRLFFQRPGTYAVQATFRGGAPVVSEPIHLSVVEPRQVRSEVLELFRSTGKEANFLHILYKDRAVAERFEKVAALGSAGPYLLYMRWALANYYYQAERFDEAIRSFEEIVRTWPDWWLRPEAEYCAARARYWKARWEFIRIVKQYPGWDVSRRAEQVWRGSDP